MLKSDVHGKKYFLRLFHSFSYIVYLFFYLCESLFTLIWHWLPPLCPLQCVLRSASWLVPTRGSVATASAWGAAPNPTMIWPARRASITNTRIAAYRTVPMAHSCLRAGVASPWRSAPKCIWPTTIYLSSTTENVWMTVLLDSPAVTLIGKDAHLRHVPLYVQFHVKWRVVSCFKTRMDHSCCMAFKGNNSCLLLCNWISHRSMTLWNFPWSDVYLYIFRHWSSLYPACTSALCIPLDKSSLTWTLPDLSSSHGSFPKVVHDEGSQSV